MKPRLIVRLIERIKRANTVLIEANGKAIPIHPVALKLNKFFGKQ